MRDFQQKVWYMKFYIDFDEDEEVGAYQGIYPVGEFKLADFNTIIGSKIKKIELENGYMIFEVEPDPNRLTKEDKRKYWDNVCDCLVEIFGLEREDADFKADELCSRIEEDDTGDPMDDLFYHEEPLYVACGIMGDRLMKLTEEQYAQYKVIQERHW